MYPNLGYILGYSIERFLPYLVDWRCFSSTFVILGGVFMILGGVFVLCSATVDRSVERATRAPRAYVDHYVCHAILGVYPTLCLTSKVCTPCTPIWGTSLTVSYRISIHVSMFDSCLTHVPRHASRYTTPNHRY